MYKYFLLYPSLYFEFNRVNVLIFQRQTTETFLGIENKHFFFNRNNSVIILYLFAVYNNRLFIAGRGSVNKIFTVRAESQGTNNDVVVLALCLSIDDNKTPLARLNRIGQTFAVRAENNTAISNVS